MPITENATHKPVSQKAAEALWAAATSEDHNIAWSRSPVYKALERAFIEAVKIEFGFGTTRAYKVRDLLAELGPFDSCINTSAGSRGVVSYAEYVLANRGREF